MTSPPRQPAGRSLGLRTPSYQPRITALIPAAPGWVARYKRGDGPLHVAPLCAWALMVNEDGTTFVGGIDPSGEEWDGGPAHDPHDFVFITPGVAPRRRGARSARGDVQYSPPRRRVTKRRRPIRQKRIPKVAGWPPERGLPYLDGPPMPRRGVQGR